MTDDDKIKAIKAYRAGEAPEAIDGHIRLDLPAVREMRMEGEDFDGDTMSARVSSDIPLDRSFLGLVYREVLHHSRKAIRLDRVRDGGIPLLVNHNRNSLALGTWTKATIESDGGNKWLRMECDLGGTKESADLQESIRAGYMSRLSVSWDTLWETNKKMEPEKMDDNEMKKSPSIRFDIREWEPMEVSAVSVPADNSCGFGRMHSRSFFLPKHIFPVQSDSGGDTREAVDNNPNSHSAKPISQSEDTTMSDIEARNTQDTAAPEAAPAPAPVAEARSDEEAPPRAARAPKAKPAVAERADETPDPAVEAVATFEAEAYRYMNIGAAKEDIDAARAGLLSGEHKSVRDAQAAVRAAMAERSKGRAESATAAVNVMTAATRDCKASFSLADAIKARYWQKPDEGANREFMTDAMREHTLHPSASANPQSIPLSADIMKRDPMLKREFERSFMRSPTRAITVGGGTAGEGIDNYQFRDDFIPVLVEQSMLLQKYDRFPGILTQDIRQPVQTGSQEFSWTTEGGARGDNDTGYTYSGNANNSRNWEYHNVKTAQRISDRAMDQHPSLYNMLVGTMLRDLVREIEQTTLDGNTSNDEPAGIVNFDGIEDLDAAEAVTGDPHRTTAPGTNAGNAVSLSDLLHLEQTAREAHIDQVPGDYCYLTTAAVVNQLRRTRAIDNSTDSKTLLETMHTLLPNGMSMSKAYSHNGYEVMTSEFVPKTSTRGSTTNLHYLIGLKPMALKLAFFSMPVFIIDPYTLAGNGNLLVRLRQAVSWNYTFLNAFGIRSQIDPTQ